MKKLFALLLTLCLLLALTGCVKEVPMDHTPDKENSSAAGDTATPDKNAPSGGDAKWLVVLSGACSIGIFGYLCANEIVKGWGNTIATLAGALSMMAIVKFIVPKHPKLAEYSLGIAMIIGMACAVVYDLLAA